MEIAISKIYILIIPLIILCAISIAISIYIKNQELKQEKIKLEKMIVERDAAYVNSYIIDKDTLDFYQTQLNEMITYYSTFKIDELIGLKFRENKAIDADFISDDVLDAVESVGKSIVSVMPIIMKTHLYTFKGKEWTHEYIRMRTTSLCLNYIKQKLPSMKINN